MIPIVSIVGVKNCGKTTLVEKLVPELVSRGYKVGSIKHDVHDFDMDHPGKDSWRHTQSGTRITAISSPKKVAVIEKVEREMSLPDIVGRYFRGVDIILTEGYKRESKTKVEIIRDEVSKELLSSRNQLLFVATNTDRTFDGLQAIDLDDAKSMVDLIIEKVMVGVGNNIDLIVDGKSIPLNKIMKSMLINTVDGLTSSLKGVGDPKVVEIKIERDKD